MLLFIERYHLKGRKMIVYLSKYFHVFQGLFSSRRENVRILQGKGGRVKDCVEEGCRPYIHKGLYISFYSPNVQV